MTSREMKRKNWIFAALRNCILRHINNKDNVKPGLTYKVMLCAGQSIPDITKLPNGHDEHLKKKMHNPKQLHNLPFRLKC